MATAAGTSKEGKAWNGVQGGGRAARQASSRERGGARRRFMAEESPPLSEEAQEKANLHYHTLVI